MPLEACKYSRSSRAKRCKAPMRNNNAIEFLQLKNYRNEKVTITVNVTSGEKVAARFIATYVVKPKKEK